MTKAILFLSFLPLGILIGQDYEHSYMELVANPQYWYTSDVWGYTDENGHDFAVFGTYDGTIILDVSTNPSNPVETGFISGATSGWRDLKTHGDYLYVTNETEGGLDIIDLSDPWHPFLAGQYAQTFTTAHNLFIADGYAYIVGANTGSGGIRILNLTDPVSPVEVGSWETNYIHDIYVKNDTAYASGISTDTLYILDVLDKTSISTLAVIPDIPNSHSNWVSNDSKYLFSASETEGGHIIIFDIQDFSNINVLAYFEVGSGKTVHNVFIKDNLMYLSYYVFGTRVVDISDPYNPEEVAYFDLYPGEQGLYAGNWGTYPFTNSGLIYSTSMSGDGFFILQYTRFVEFDHESLGDTEDVDGPYTVSVIINATEGNEIVQETAIAVSGLNADFMDTTYLVAGDEPGEFTSAIPGYGIAGDFTYYFAIQNTTGQWSTEPYDAPGNHYSFYVGSDTVSPVIASVTKLTNTIDNSGTYTIQSQIEDNIGVDHNTVFLHYRLNSLDFDSTNMTFNAQSGLFSGNIDFGGAIESNDTVSYFVSAYDLSAAGNRTDSPFQQFEIVSTLVVDDFESGVENWLINQGWEPYIYAHSGDYSIQESPEGFYDDNSEYILKNINSYNLSSRSEAYLSFWHIYSIADGDSANVEVSTDGVSWEVEKTFIGSNNYVWEMEVVSLEDYVGMDNVHFRFRITTDESGTADGWYIDDIVFHVDTTLLAVDEPVSAIPLTYALKQNYPNPFNPITNLQFDLPEGADVKLVIYNLLGQKVTTLMNRNLQAGYHNVLWNGRDAFGKPVGSGVYIYRMTAGDFTSSKKMLLLK